jgi:dolichyl-phosphate-mannose-protein mannosyltransferase
LFNLHQKIKNIYKLSSIFILSFIFLNMLSILSFAQVTFTNNGFEQYRDGIPVSWVQYSWENKGTFSVDTKQKYSGNSSAVIENKAATDTRLMQQIRVEEKSKYKITCWVKTQNVGSDMMGANIGIETVPISSTEIKGDSDWTKIALYGETDSGQKLVTVTLGIGGYGSSNTGKAWFDDIQIEKIENFPVGENTVKFFMQTNNETQNGSSNLLPVIIIFALLILISLATFFVIKPYIKNSSLKSAINTTEINSQTKKTKDFKWMPSIDKKDVLIITALTLIYLFIALYNLGSRNVPTTEWTPLVAGESFEITLDKATSLQRISYYNGLGSTRDANGTYRVDYMDNNGVYKQIGVINKKDIFCWKYIDINNIVTSRLKITAEIPGGTLTELGFFETGSKEPLKGVTLSKQNMNSPDASNLFDEQNTVIYDSSFMTDMYFDEIYHARTAYEFIHHIEPYENTHPPLGKVFISFFILIFGMVPFGWRIAGTIAGILMLPVMYLFGKQLFEKRFYAFLSAFLMMFDFMHFTQTRIATIDSFVTLFVILMFYFMNWFFINTSRKISFNVMILPLLLSGISFGLGAASKWIAIYGAAGLALMYLWWWFETFNTEYSMINKFKKNASSALIFISKAILPAILIGTAFFAIIPLILYIASFIPYLMVPGSGHDFVNIYDYQVTMFSYHKNLVATHPFSSPWYEWPFMVRPIWYYSGNSGLPVGNASTIAALGNPAVWWLGAAVTIALFVYMVINFISSRKYDRKIIVIFIAIASQYLPWVLIPRLTFIYHYFSIVPFIILAIVYIIKKLEMISKNFRFMTYIYMALVVILFILFYPVISGQPASVEYINSLKWFGSWSF